MNTLAQLPCVLGSELVAQVVSGFTGTLLNNDKEEKVLLSQIDDKIQTACDSHLGATVKSFFNRADAVELALAFDVRADHLEALQSGTGLKAELIESTRKIILLGAVTATMSLESLGEIVADHIPTFH